VGAVAARPVEQLPAAEEEREGGAERVSSDESGHNTVIVAVMAQGNNPGPTDELTRRLVDTAGRLLADHGVDGLSLRRLATAADTSTMSVYTRFGGKPQLLTAMYREGFARLGSFLAEASEGGRAPLELLAETGRAYRRAALASPTLYGLMFGPPPPGLDPSPEDAEAAHATFRPLVDAVSRCVAEGDLVGDPERIALHLWAVVHGMVGLELAGRLPVDADQAEEEYERALAFSAAPFFP
jgi:AcrR family transcriptional regulator